MKYRIYLLIVSTVCIGLLVSSTNARASALLRLRRVNVPYFSGLVQFPQMAIFWYGRVTTSEDYTDVRVGYNNNKLVVLPTVFDRQLWWDESPTPAELPNWDAVTLYLDIDGHPGTVLDGNAYRFDAQINAWTPDRLPWQAAYQGNGTQWQSSSFSFDTESGFNATPNNNSDDDRGWRLVFNIPFSSLGLSGPPPQGTVWRMAIVTHDRDSAVGPPNGDKVWPENMTPLEPSTWGELYFGTPSYMPPQVSTQGTTVIRQGLNGAVVPDGEVGGGTLCGDTTNYFTDWGNKNYAHVLTVNVQNQDNIGDWPCFSKYFVTFPLNNVPVGKKIISATLTLRQSGNAGAGWNPGPQPSYIQVLTIDQDWDENTLTWNNEPLARENIAAKWVNPFGPTDQPWPGIVHNWDVSRAVAEAYSAGEPLRLAAYSADEATHSGRYFYSSDSDQFAADARPTLTVVWGSAGPTLHKSVRPASTTLGKSVTYTLSIIGSGQALTLTDDLPTSVSAPGSLNATAGNASYNAGAHRITWLGSPPSGQPVTITLPVTVLVASPTAITNRAVLTDSALGSSSDTVTVIANGWSTWLPMVMK